MRKTIWRALISGAAVIGAVAVLAPNTRAGRTLRHEGARLAKRVRFARGRAKGVAYRVAGRTPDPTVTDDVLADRVRSSLGGLEKRLDMPRVHILVEGHVVLLHGDVPSQADATALEHAVQATSGVRGVESYLHVGLPAGSTRPSTGRAQTEAAGSPALRQLLGAAHDAGAAAGQGRSAVRAVLVTFADRIPASERAQLLGHLPVDVRELAAPPRRHGERAARLRTVTELVAATATEGEMDAAHAEAIIEAVLGNLRQLVPEEAADVAAVLPTELRRFWTSAVPT
jgi:uncharacterized protein (DUF2267 family)